ncbi:unnamed protein product [Parascedosporium putredinis]|uniref:Presequence protease, mitochondrial n=1 Tax=Parascedosporium putredinis TaxID=1442378 RepID=A0A9P1GUI7_9PEZI|nr:unnamed protein product [Parascedosporium putredinis]CAI7987361.1 unnamed protein product [Parascedosporium putredinis]
MLRTAARQASHVAQAATGTAATDAALLPKIGEKLHGFTLLRSKHVPELKLTALHLKHDSTGADYLHIARDDNNNVFSVGFKTNPPDDTGIPHILEHTTLCGSEKYPIRDPFFKMLPRTLSNFMNAFTASDHTYYPFATTNAQDYKNLMSEGWRIGPENPQAAPEEEGSKLVFKGVVYNEMKGQMSDAGYLYYIRFQDHIFPDINNSGGDPQKITDLTYEQLKQFHAENYHPSNAKFFTYGDMPLKEHLQEVDARLGRFNQTHTLRDHRRPVDLSSGPVQVTVSGPIDPLVDPDRQYKASVSWVTGETKNTLESFSLSLMASLLLDGYGSPLYKGLIESGLGTDWSPNTGYDSSPSHAILSVGLSGIKEADVPKLKAEIRRILEEVREKGFDLSKIDGAIHQIELGLKHKTANFGLSLLHRLKSKWFSGVDPFDALAWNETVDAFRAKLAKGGYLEGLLDKYLLNDNTLTFVMAPSPTYGQEIVEEEQQRLASKIGKAASELGGEAEARKTFEAQELMLLKEQGKTKTEDLECLPSVHVADIPREAKRTVLRHDKLGNVNVQWREAPTNGLTYFRAINTIEGLPDELRQLMPLFADSIMRLGTKDMTMEQLEDLIKLKTGGVSVGYRVAPSPTNFREATEGIAFSGMALDRNVPAMFDILRKLVVETNFDSPETPLRIRQLLQASADGLVNDIASSGHQFARGYAESGLTRAAWLQQQVGGLSQVKLITSLAGRPESDGLSDVIEKLKRIQQIVLSGDKMRTAVTCGTESVQANASALGQFLSARAGSTAGLSSSTSGSASLPTDKKSFFPLPYQVYYGGLSVPTTSYTEAEGAPLQVLAQLLTHKHLHHEIREKGGAYGGGAYCSALDGLFGFYSYRDPNPLNTMSIMQDAGRWAREKEWADRDLEEAKISVFQRIDAPRSVNEEGMNQFLFGITDEMKQTRRERLLDVTKEQVREVAQKYLVDGLEKGAERVAFIGQKQPWVNDSWTVHEMDSNSSQS